VTGHLFDKLQQIAHSIWTGAEFWGKTMREANSGDRKVKMNRRMFLQAAATAISAAPARLTFGEQAAPAQAAALQLSVPGATSAEDALVPRFGDGRDWWFKKRFGMFVHWGLYSIAGWHEQMEWRQSIPRAQYEKLFEQWNPQQFNPDAWLDLAESAGMEYICITTKHHDGFCLWDTKLTTFNTMRTPYGKDALRQLADACHRRNFPLCLYYSVVDWHSPLYPNQGRSHEIPAQAGDHPDLAKYIEFLKGQVTELCTNYGKISGFWWDMRIDKVSDPSINAMIRRLQPEAVINNRGFDEGDFSTPERDNDRSLDLPLNFKHRTEACQSVGMESWGYRKDEDYYSLRYLTSSIDKYRARDANYLLNVGPDGDGVIPQKPAEILHRIGEWYRPVRESFDGAIPISTITANRGVLVTRKNNSLYVHIYQLPEGEEIRLSPLAIAPQRATLLNDGRPVEWRLDIAPMEWVDRKPYLRLHQMPVEEFAGATMVVRLDFASLKDLKLGAPGTDPGKGVLTQ
jgi:alpha-L-fucosidase